MTGDITDPKFHDIYFSHKNEEKQSQQTRLTDERVRGKEGATLLRIIGSIGVSEEKNEMAEVTNKSKE